MRDGGSGITEGLANGISGRGWDLRQALFRGCLRCFYVAGASRSGQSLQCRQAVRGGLQWRPQLDGGLQVQQLWAGRPFEKVLGASMGENAALRHVCQG